MLTQEQEQKRGKLLRSRWSTQSFHVKEEIFVVLQARKGRSPWPSQRASLKMREKPKASQGSGIGPDEAALRWGGGEGIGGGESVTSARKALG